MGFKMLLGRLGFHISTTEPEIVKSTQIMNSLQLSDLVKRVVFNIGIRQASL
jgi:hypothetical protein